MLIYALPILLKLGLLKRYPPQLRTQWKRASVENVGRDGIETGEMYANHILHHLNKHQSVQVFEHIPRHLKGRVNAKEYLKLKVCVVVPYQPSQATDI